jgi:hypothetical protein
MSRSVNKVNYSLLDREVRINLKPPPPLLGQCLLHIYLSAHPNPVSPQVLFESALKLNTPNRLTFEFPEEDRIAQVAVAEKMGAVSAVLVVLITILCERSPDLEEHQMRPSTPISGRREREEKSAD